MTASLTCVDDRHSKIMAEFDWRVVGGAVGFLYFGCLQNVCRKTVDFLFKNAKPRPMRLLEASGSFWWLLEASGAYVDDRLDDCVDDMR